MRAIYLTDLKEGDALVVSIAKRVGAGPSSVRSALNDASRRKLVKLAGGRVRLTNAGRRRLKVVMMGGAFEIIHPGHVHAISEAKTLGNTLVVVIATDGSVEKNKGRAPVTNQAIRVRLVSSLREVDLALPGNEGSIYDILLRIRPDVIALGYDQHHNGEEIEREAARRGLRIRCLRLGTPIPGVKTSKILLSL